MHNTSDHYFNETQKHFHSPQYCNTFSFQVFFLSGSTHVNFSCKFYYNHFNIQENYKC